MASSYHITWKTGIVKAALMVVLSFSFLIDKTGAQEANPWENPNINSINKEQSYAYGFLAGEKAYITMIWSLNGIWRFKWSPNRQSRPVDFYTENYSTENWNNILVPGIWDSDLYQHNVPMNKYTNRPYQCGFILEYKDGN